MFFSVKYINIKLNQDYADFDDRTLIICDGIGEFPNSGIVSKIVVEQYISKKYKSISELIYDKKLLDLRQKGIEGGTTLISAKINKSDKVELEYLGNGGIIHLHGDFSTNVNSEKPYRYGDLMNPHISPNGSLTKHISHNSEKQEMNSTKITLNLNYTSGDIILLFSDGISSLEDKVILLDNENRFWRIENPAIQLILKELNLFLKSNFNSENFKESLIEFNGTILKKLKSENYLEDDASLGFIITENVINHYKEKLHND